MATGAQSNLARAVTAEQALHAHAKGLGYAAHDIVRLHFAAAGNQVDQGSFDELRW